MEGKIMEDMDMAHRKIRILACMLLEQLMEHPLMATGITSSLLADL